jgi:CheY-like chemotaxis protein
MQVAQGLRADPTLSNLLIHCNTTVTPLQHQVATAIRADLKLKDVLIIGLTGSVFADDIAAFIEAGTHGERVFLKLANPSNPYKTLLALLTLLNILALLTLLTLGT